MQLYVIDWVFKNSEDQLFATNEFCEYFKKNIFNKDIDGVDLKFIAHKPQIGSGTIICRAQDTKSILKPLKQWRDSYNISFNIHPALTNEELFELNSVEDFWKDE